MDEDRLADIREEYLHAPLRSSDLLDHPVRQFEQWFDEVLKLELTQPNVMILSTVSPEGHPSSRVVLLKGIENGRLLFYTNYNSRKAREIDKNPRLSILFYWTPLARQVRIEGTAERLSPERSTQYFNARPRGSQISAWASPQSLSVQSREALEEKARRIAEKYKELENLPRPEFWGGYAIKPHRFEFWQGRKDRLHDRFLYHRPEAGDWVMNRLGP